uniref:Cyclin T2b n=1 Tax=Kryptolebias marmoratus TaxID=37003 RepID=A0A3Q3AM25_KRYMA
MATNSLHLTTFCLQYRPTVVACVCIHLACKWSNWEIPVSTDGKHWWEYVDRTVTLQLLDELTHEFLQILERTPSKLKRIRNWRAIQAAKKPKSDGVTVESAFQGASLESLPGVANSFFPSASTSDSFSQPAHSDFTLVKHKHKAVGGSGGEHHQAGAPAAAALSRSQKVLTLEKYREKHAAELALQKGAKDELGAEAYSAHHHHNNHHHHHHRKRSQPQQAGDGRREKAGSKKSRHAASFVENGANAAASEEFKMRIKVSSEQGGTLSGKDKHKEHGGHRHSKHSYSLGGHGRGAADNASFSVRAPDGGSAGSSRKRQHSDAAAAGHNHHHSSKSGRSSKGGLSSSHYSSDGGQRMMELRDGTNGMLVTNGQHTDYKNTFDMLDSLLSFALDAVLLPAAPPRQVPSWAAQ